MVGHQSGLLLHVGLHVSWSLYDSWSSKITRTGWWPGLEKGCKQASSVSALLNCSINMTNIEQWRQIVVCKAGKSKNDLKSSPALFFMTIDRSKKWLETSGLTWKRGQTRSHSQKNVNSKSNTVSKLLLQKFVEIWRSLSPNDVTKASKNWIISVICRLCSF